MRTIRRPRGIPIVLAAGLLLAPTARAQEHPGTRAPGHRADRAADSVPRREIVRDQSHIAFDAAARFQTVHGRFERWEAELRLDTARIRRSSVVVVIDAGSFSTSNDARDDELRGKDFLWVERFPEIRFTSTKVNRVDAATLHLLGELEMRGVKRTVMVPVTLAWDERGRGHLSGTLSFSRRAFGMTFDNPANPIEDEVRVPFEIVVVPRDAHATR
jgi:polyisoprenoid-binding protein YceI